MYNMSQNGFLLFFYISAEVPKGLNIREFITTLRQNYHSCELKQYFLGVHQFLIFVLDFKQ